MSKIKNVSIDFIRDADYFDEWNNKLKNCSCGGKAHFVPAVDKAGFKIFNTNVIKCKKCGKTSSQKSGINALEDLIREWNQEPLPNDTLISLVHLVQDNLNVDSRTARAKILQCWLSLKELWYSDNNKKGVYDKACLILQKYTELNPNFLIVFEEEENNCDPYNYINE